MGTFKINEWGFAMAFGILFSACGGGASSSIEMVSKEKYEKQYNNLEIINTNIFHDRFIIIDNKVLYHSGASFKDLGKKCFAITKMEGDSILKELLNKIS